MKKLLSVVLLTVLLLNIVFMYGCAPKIYEYDSLKLPELEQKTFRKGTDSIVIKLYCGPFNTHIATKGSVDDTIDDILGYASNASYISVSPEDHSVRRIVDTDSYRRINMATYEDLKFYHHSWIDFYKYALDPQLAFADFEEPVEVYNVWCLAGECWEQRDYIYYSTNQGIYLLYNERTPPGSSEDYIPVLYTWEDMYHKILEWNEKNKSSIF